MAHSIDSHNSAFGMLGRSMGRNFAECAADPSGWRASEAFHYGPATRLTKPVPGTEYELRLLRFGRESDFKYAIEVGPVGSPQTLCHGEGMADGDPKFRQPFENALQKIHGAR